MFTVIEPTVHNVCQYQFDKHPEGIRDIRPDTLSQMMAYANVRPGGKVMIIEDVHGLVVSAAVERMGGPSSRPICLESGRLNVSGEQAKGKFSLLTMRTRRRICT